MYCFLYDNVLHHERVKVINYVVNKLQKYFWFTYVIKIQFILKITYDNETIFVPSGDGFSKITSHMVPNFVKVESCWYRTIRKLNSTEVTFNDDSFNRRIN